MVMTTLITLLFLGSGAGLMIDRIDQTRASIEAEVGDASARKAALGIVERAEDTSKDYAKADSEHEQQLLELIWRHETTADELQQHLGAAYEKRIHYQQQMLALRFELKDQLTREQWEKIFSKEKLE